MNEWEDKLNALLSDPDAMAQVMSIAQNLSAQTGAEPAPPAGGAPDALPASAPREKPAAPAGAAGADANGTAELAARLSQLAGGLDPALLRRLMPIAKELNRPGSGETAALLRSLRPFLSEARRDKVERAIQLARLIHLAKLFLGGERFV